MEILSILERFIPREGQLWLSAALGLLLAGWFKGINLLILLAFLMLALWGVNLIASFRQLRFVHGQRKHRGPFFAGEVSLWDVELTNPRRATASGWRVVDGGSAHEQSWFLDQLAGGQTIRCAARAVFPTRGIYRAGPLIAQCRHPFGLTQRNRKIGGDEQWIILPALGHLDIERFRSWMARLARSDGQIIRTSRPSMTRQDDLHGLRPFRPGDSPRWIHWRTSARRNQKMVREFEESSGQNLILIVDPWGTPDQLPTLDRAISLAATICWEWSRHGHDQLFFAAATPTPVIVSGSSTREKSLLMLRELAIVAGESSPNANLMLQAISRKVVPDAPVIVVSARRDSPLAATLSTAWNRRVIALYVDDAAPFYQPPAPKRPSPLGENR